ncbi:MAG: thioesterase [Sphingomonas sp.]|nr:thioesterase [Sphingomonas sp.]
MHVPDDPHLLERVRESFARQSFMALIGTRVVSASHGTVVLELPFRADLCQQNGFLHGGVVGAIADVAGGYAAYSVFGDGEDVLTVEYKLNLIRPAAGERLRATGEVLRAGRTLTVCDLKVHVVHAGAELLCASGQQTLMRMEAGRA